jgi:hypothetical protein
VGKKDRPQPSGGNQLMQCPNFNTCQTMVRANQRGNPHKYGVYDSARDEIVYKDCSGG